MLTLLKHLILFRQMYRVSHFIFLYFEQQLFHLRNNFLMFKIRFHILQTLKFYDISSFFDLSLALFHKLVFFKNNFLYQKFFFENFWKIFFALNSFLGWFMTKKKISKKFQKKFWPKKIRNFFQNLICEKVPSLSQKMMIYHKIPMSGAYKNVF